MPSTRLYNCAFQALSYSLLLFAPSAAAQNACQFTSPRIQTVVHEQVVSVNTEVLTNTSFYPIPEVGITVTDAPTSLDAMTTLTWSETRSYTSFDSTLSSPYTAITTSASASSPIGTDANFVLIIQGGLSKNQKRQSNHYIGANGSTTTDCSNAPVYTISNGILTATINGVAYYYSTDGVSSYAQFVPTTTPGPIKTTFSAAPNGLLSWSNAAFWNGAAQFCSLDKGTVYATFQQDAFPDGCVFIQLTLYSPSCAAQPGSTGATGESPP